MERHWIFVHGPSSFTISQPSGDSGGSSGGVAPLTGKNRLGKKMRGRPTAIYNSDTFQMLSFVSSLFGDSM